MDSLSGKARTAETYLAGLGASGALVAAAVVASLLLIGAITFDAWPGVSDLFGGEDPGVEPADPSGPAASAAVVLGPAADQVVPAGPGDPLVAGR